MSQYLVRALRAAEQRWLRGLPILLCLLCSCTAMERPDGGAAARLRETASLVEEVKEFGKTVGIEPTGALNRSIGSAPPLSMLWVWMQRLGTLALHAAIDVRMAIGFAAVKEDLKLERIYRVDGYSVYYRQGNEFADPRAVATVSFAEEGIVRRVKVILHEDLHGDQNFALPWDVEESLVTPLSSLAAVEFFRRKDDGENLNRAVAALQEERQFARELNELADRAERLLQSEPLDEAKKKILALMPSYPAYARLFRRQTVGQNPGTVLEAKLSHDLAYYRHFDAVVALAQNAPHLRSVIDDLKALPSDVTWDDLASRLRALDAKSAAAKK